MNWPKPSLAIPASPGSLFPLKTPTGTGYDISPTMIYRDMNLGGTGWEFTGAYSGVFLKMQFVYPEHKGLPPDLGFSVDGLFYPRETQFYDKGREADWSIESWPADICLLAEKELFAGLTVQSTHNINFFDYSGSGTDLVLPSEHFTYTGDFTLSYFPGGEGGTFSPHSPSGFFMKVNLAVIGRFKQESWGPSGDLYTHDDKPGYKASYLFGCGWKFHGLYQPEGAVCLSSGNQSV